MWLLGGMPNPPYTNFDVLSCRATGRAFRIIPYNPLHPADGVVLFVKLKIRYLNEALREMNTSKRFGAHDRVRLRFAMLGSRVAFGGSFGPSQHAKVMTVVFKSKRNRLASPTHSTTLAI
jgi:hypothetical protein